MAKRDMDYYVVGTKNEEGEYSIEVTLDFGKQGKVKFNDITKNQGLLDRVKEFASKRMKMMNIIMDGCIMANKLDMTKLK